MEDKNTKYIEKIRDLINSMKDDNLSNADLTTIIAFAITHAAHKTKNPLMFYQVFVPMIEGMIEDEAKEVKKCIR